MTKYVVKRVLLAILTVFIVCAITFFAMNAIPGGPFDGEKAISDEVRRSALIWISLSGSSSFYI